MSRQFAKGLLNGLFISVGLWALIIVLCLSISVYADIPVLNMTFNSNQGVYNSTYATDLSGYSHNSIYVNATYYSNYGFLNGSYKFNKSLTKGINITDFDTVGNDYQNITVCAFINGTAYTNDATGVTNTIIGQYDSGGNDRSWYMDITVSRMLLRVATVCSSGIFNSTCAKVYNSTVAVVNNSWNQVCFSFGAGNLTLYINGNNVSVIKEYDGNFTTLKNPSKPITIGWRQGSNYFNGSIDEVLIYNYTLNPTEVLSLYSSYFPSTEPVIYYFNQSGGSDSNNCSSPATACKTITKANTLSLNAGDSVLFAVDNMWHFPQDAFITLTSGDSTGNITYGSYGNRSKPLFYGSYNVSNTANWSDNGGNIWNSTFTSSIEIGQLSYNNDESLGLIASAYSNLNTQGEFFYNSTTDKVYIYSTSNPATYYSSIEAGIDDNIIDTNNIHDVVIQNLELKNGARHGIEGASNENIYIFNNTLSYIGGAYQSGTLRYGNCIQFWDDSSNIKVIGNSISYCYDAGISPQSDECGHDMINHEYSYNILTNNRYHIEIFNWVTGCSADQGWLKNVSIHHNTMAYAGTDDYRTVNGQGIQLSTATGNTSDVNFTNNIFAYSDYREIQLEGTGNHYNWNGQYPNFNYNLYYNTNTQYIMWENDLYSNVSAFYAGQGMERNGNDSNPYFISTDINSKYFLVPNNLTSKACNMSSTGSYVGVLPCQSYTEVQPSYLYINFTSNTTSGTVNQNYIYVGLNTSSSTSDHYSFVDFDRSLIGWYTFDSRNSTHIYDNSSYHLAGYISQNATNITGKYKQGFSFDGVNDNIQIYNTNINTTYTMCAWVNPSSLSSTRAIIHTGDGRELDLYNGNFAIYGSAWVIGGNISINNWYHLCVSRNNTATNGYKGYFNGRLNITTTRSTITTSNLLTIGTTITSTNDYAGIIDEVLIFNRTLNDIEILSIYNSSITQYSNTFNNLNYGSYNFTGYAVDTDGNVNFTNRNVTIGCVTPYENMVLYNDTTFCKNTYYFSDSTNQGAIIINASDIVLDCNDATIIGNHTSGSFGIYNYYRNNLIVRNCNVYNYYTNVQFYGQRNISFFNNTLSNATFQNMQIVDGKNTTIDSCNFTNSITEHGIYITGPNSNTITVKNSNFINNDNHGIHLNDGTGHISNFIIVNNTFDGNRQDALSLYSGKNGLITNNIIKNEPVGFTLMHDANLINGSINITITQNNFTNITTIAWVRNQTFSNIMFNNSYDNSNVNLLINDMGNYNFSYNETFTGELLIDYEKLNSNITFNYSGRKDFTIINRSITINSFEPSYNCVYNDTEQLGCYLTPQTFTINANEQYYVMDDITSPIVSLISPANSSTVASNSIDFNYSAFDGGSGISNCSLFINNLLNRTMQNNSNFTTTSIGNGNYYWSVNCTDNDSNTGYSGSYNLTICVPSMVNTSITVTNLTCQANNTMRQNASWVQWDTNLCGGTNTTYYQIWSNASCNYQKIRSILDFRHEISNYEPTEEYCFVYPDGNYCLDKTYMGKNTNVSDVISSSGGNNADYVNRSEVGYYNSTTINDSINNKLLSYPLANSLPNITWEQIIASIGNWSNDKVNYPISSSLPNLSRNDIVNTVGNYSAAVLTNFTPNSNCTGTDKAIGFYTNGTIICAADQTGGGSSDGTGNWSNLTSMNATYTPINVVTDGFYYQEDSPALRPKLLFGNSRKEVFFNDMNLLITAYNRVTTAPTINNVDADIPSSMNFPTAATALSDGGLIVAGNTATASSIINASKMSYFEVRAKQVALINRSDWLGIYKTETTLVKDTAKTGIYFRYNWTVGAVVDSQTNGYWWANVCNNAVCTSVNTTVLADTNWHTFDIIGNSTDSISGNYSFYIDNTLRASIATNIPTTKVSTLGTWTELNKAGAAQTLRVDWVYYEINR